MNNVFPILSVETSGELCSAAIMLTDSSFSEINILKKNIHSKKLLASINTLLDLSELKLNDIKQIAISMGPGSFTGLRIGMSTVKGLAFGLSIPIVPVPTYEAAALQISEYLSGKDQFVLVNNANIEEVYIGRYLVKEQCYTVIEPVKLVKKSKLKEYITDDVKIFGDFIINGNQKKIPLPLAIYVAKWSYFFGADLLTSNYDYLEPNYLKNFVLKVKK